jgi:hypothetical protein
MSPGPVEEGAKVASGVVDALRSEPISLALIVMNIIFVGGIAWWAHEINIRTTHQYEVKDILIEKLIDQCRQGKATFNAPILTEPSRNDVP